MAAELYQLARCAVPRGAAWCDARLTLAGPALICAGYASGLLTHGAQLAPGGALTLRALPVLPGEGEWVLLGDRPVRAEVALSPRAAAALPGFSPAPDCTGDCHARDVGAVRIEWRAHGLKALAYPEEARVAIDPSWWAEVPSVPTRLAVLAHELGHLAGAECQRCADVYAGQVLEAQGISYRDPVNGFDAILRGQRPAAANFLRGYLHG